MRKPDFQSLERALIAADVAPRFVERMIQELADHVDDAEADAVVAGFTRREARAAAFEALGSQDAILAAVARCPELKCWHCRWPRAAALLNGAGQCVLLPAVPFAYCAHHGSSIARWSASAGLGALVTGALLFSMQLALA